MQHNGLRSKKRIWLRRVLWLAGAVIILLGVILLFWLRGALYNRFVRFPREEAAWQAIQALFCASSLLAKAGADTSTVAARVMCISFITLLLQVGKNVQA